MFAKDLFCSRLKSLRLEKNLTLEQLGAIFGVTKQTVSRWETGDRLPSIEIVYILAEYFNVSLDYLTGRTDKLDLVINNVEQNISEEESELLEDFRLLNKYEQNIIMGKISEMIYNKNINDAISEVSEELVEIDFKNRLNK